MAFLSSTATIDAILTQQGRLLLSQGNFNPSKFAFGDSEIDYGLLAFPDGENMILSTNILEASSLGGNLDTEMQYKLITDASGLGKIATLNVNPSSVNPIIYDILIVNVTTNYGTDTSYTVKNNSNFATLNPYWAITVLNQQKYMAVSNKDYATVLASLQNYASIYNKNLSPRATNPIAQVLPLASLQNYASIYNKNLSPLAGSPRATNPIAQVLPEVFNTIQAPGSNTQSFFVFIADQGNDPFNISIQGNNTGAVSNLTVGFIEIV